MDGTATGTGIGQPVRRREDLRLLTGRGIFVADLPLREPYAAAILRSALEFADGNPGLRVAITMPFDAASTAALAPPPQETAAGEGIVSATLASS